MKKKTIKDLTENRAVTNEQIEERVFYSPYGQVKAKTLKEAQKKIINLKNKQKDENNRK